MRSAELFSGCGGLALGMSRAGFEHVLMVEFNADAVATTEFNKKQGVPFVSAWPLIKEDVRNIDWTKFEKQVSVISGGPPCQPFGIGGKKNGSKDQRDMWPEAIRAVRETKPDGFLFENVRNLAGPRFRDYLEWVVAYLSHPSEVRRKSETHVAHLRRLRNLELAPAYTVGWQVVNAADYGAPQIRFRVLIFGIKHSMNSSPILMRPTHSRDRLLWDQYVTGEYWKRHNMAARSQPIDARDRSRLSLLRKRKDPPPGLPWVTARDAISGLGEPNSRQNHIFQDGARVYPGHTGSLLDMPAKALKAGDHGVPGGENMMVRDDGTVRYFTLREAARLVGLPDQYAFPRSWTESMRQLGNAVPTQLAESAARLLMKALKSRICEKDVKTSRAA